VSDDAPKSEGALPPAKVKPRGDPERYSHVENLIIAGASEAQIVAATVERFQIRGREVRLILRRVRAAMVKATEVSPEVQKAVMVAQLTTIYRLAIKTRPQPHLGTALTALGQIARLCGLEAAQKVAMQVSGLDLGGDGVLTLPKIEERLRDLTRRSAKRTEDKDN
jgi:hypothetical protein